MGDSIGAESEGEGARVCERGRASTGAGVSGEGVNGDIIAATAAVGVDALAGVPRSESEELGVLGCSGGCGRGSGDGGAGDDDVARADDGPAGVGVDFGDRRSVILPWRSRGADCRLGGPDDDAAENGDAGTARCWRDRRLGEVVVVVDVLVDGEPCEAMSDCEAERFVDGNMGRLNGRGDVVGCDGCDSGCDCEKGGELLSSRSGSSSSSSSALSSSTGDGDAAMVGFELSTNEASGDEGL